MANPSKVTALDTLRASIEPISALHESGQKSADFLKWQRETEVAIRHIFGEKSRNADDFAEVSYSASKSAGKHQGVLYVVAVRCGLDRAKDLLESMAEEVKNYWDEDQIEQHTSSSRTLPSEVVVQDFRLLHPTIVEKVQRALLDGHYSLAVFQSFKEVEIAVRNSGNYDATDIGTELMRKAFHKSTGALTDSSLPDSEKEALAHLFAGAIGWFKNPSSHRSVPITEAAAFEAIAFASHLLRLVDARS